MFAYGMVGRAELITVLESAESLDCEVLCISNFSHLSADGVLRHSCLLTLIRQLAQVKRVQNTGRIICVKRETVIGLI